MMIFQREARFAVSVNRDIDYVTVNFKAHRLMIDREICEIRGRKNAILIERNFTQIPNSLDRWVQKLLSGVATYEPLLRIQCSEHPNQWAAFYQGTDRNNQKRVLFYADYAEKIGSFLFLIRDSDYTEIESRILGLAKI